MDIITFRDVIKKLQLKALAIEDYLEIISHYQKLKIISQTCETAI